VDRRGVRKFNQKICVGAREKTKYEQLYSAMKLRLFKKVERKIISLIYRHKKSGGF